MKLSKSGIQVFINGEKNDRFSEEGAPNRDLRRFSNDQEGSEKVGTVLAYIVSVETNYFLGGNNDGF